MPRVRYSYLRKISQANPVQVLSGGGDPVPADMRDADGVGTPQGLSWSYQMDFGALIAAITGTDPPD